MNVRHRLPSAAAALVTLLLATVATACEADSPTQPQIQATVEASDAGSTGSAMTSTLAAGSTAGGVASSPNVTVTKITLGLPYKPDVQFAPLYLAKENGHYAAEGLDVDFQYGDESSFVQLVAAGKMDATIASGDQVIQARAEDLPVRYVMAWYQRFPIAIFSDDPTLDNPAALVGHRVGLPAASGASYLGWQAFLVANKLDPAQIPTEVVGFNQVEAVLQGRVDAAVGYTVNEPERLKAEGKPVAVIEIADTFNLVSNGLVVSEADTKQRRPIIQGLVKATLLGLRDTLDDPDAALTTTIKVVPELADPAALETARTVLKASLRLWESEFGLGVIDTRAWQASVQFLREQGIIKTVPALETVIDQRFVPDANVQIVR